MAGVGGWSAAPHGVGRAGQQRWRSPSSTDSRRRDTGPLGRRGIAGLGGWPAAPDFTARAAQQRREPSTAKIAELDG
ncbi:hypothetical protein AQI96_17250 [Streptomyces canus]|nr:hypothetical protein AQI96_17250 [Streptomyces canus]